MMRIRQELNFIFDSRTLLVYMILNTLGAAFLFVASGGFFSTIIGVLISGLIVYMFVSLARYVLSYLLDPRISNKVATNLFYAVCLVSPWISWKIAQEVISNIKLLSPIGLESNPLVWMVPSVIILFAWWSYTETKYDEGTGLDY